MEITYVLVPTPKSVCVHVFLRNPFCLKSYIVFETKISNYITYSEIGCICTFFGIESDIEIRVELQLPELLIGHCSQFSKS